MTYGGNKAPSYVELETALAATQAELAQANAYHRQLSESGGEYAVPGADVARIMDLLKPCAKGDELTGSETLKRIFAEREPRQMAQSETATACPRCGEIISGIAANEELIRQREAAHQQAETLANELKRARDWIEREGYGQFAKTFDAALADYRAVSPRDAGAKG